MAAAASSSSQTALDNATRSSTASWQADLKVLFDNAKDRFADVVWEFQPDARRPPEEVWGHKAIVYARAPPAFQQRYFAFRPAPVASPVPYSTSPMPQNFGPISSVSLGIDLTSPSRSPSPYDDPRATSPTPSTVPGPLLRLQPQIDPTLFSNELEYLYTGKGFGEAFEFLFDSTNGGSTDAVQQDAEQLRVEKLRHDLNYMWRSRLYSDVRISLTGNFSSTPSNADASTAIFSSHRFVLMSRSPYFRAQLSGGFAQPPSATPGGPITLSLPSPPFTPASLHFALGYIYTGTLVFSHRTYDLDTAFAIMRSAAYLQLPQLHNEVEARIVEEMMHGLCLPYIPFAQYEQLTGGKWAAAGCKCRQCARRAPRVLAFAMETDVRNAVLENGARRTLSGLFGDGWCTPEFAALQPRVRSSLLSGLAKRTTPSNLFNLLAATQAAFKRLDKEQTDIAKKRDGTKKVADPKELDESWIATVREAIITARKVMDECLCAHAEEAFEMDDWLVLLEGDGVGFNDKDRVEGVMASLVRGLNDKNAGHVYQTLVECVLLRQHPTDANASLLSASSPIRSIVESTRAEIIKWLSKHWAGVQQAAGFDGLASWALKEIADELEVPAEDLLSPGPGPARGPATRTGLRPIMPRSGMDQDQQDTASMTSLRASVLGKQFASTPTSSSGTERGEVASLRSSPTSPVRAPPKQTVAARRSAAPVTPETARTRSLAASVDGGASTRAGVRKVSPSNASTTSVASAAYRTAGSTAPPRTRKILGRHSNQLEARIVADWQLPVPCRRFSRHILAPPLCPPVVLSFPRANRRSFCLPVPCLPIPRCPNRWAWGLTSSPQRFVRALVPSSPLRRSLLRPALTCRARGLLPVHAPRVLNVRSAPGGVLRLCTRASRRLCLLARARSLSSGRCRRFPGARVRDEALATRMTDPASARVIRSDCVVARARPQLDARGWTRAGAWYWCRGSLLIASFLSFLLRETQACSE